MRPANLLPVLVLCACDSAPPTHPVPQVPTDPIPGIPTDHLTLSPPEAVSQVDRAFLQLPLSGTDAGTSAVFGQGQNFTVGIDGSLTRLDHLLVREPGVTHNLNVTLYAAGGGIP